MQFKIPHRKNLLCTAVSLSLLPLSGISIAQDDSIEEVLVTGSFIRRSEGFTAASAVTQLTAQDLENEGTLNLGEVVQNLSFVNGASSAITNTIQGTDSRSSQIDLRGLGPRSTLTLLDGKRLANENVNALIPTIAIQRLDIVTDGAAALYGNEAVAGVVNFVPYKSYDGLKIDTYAEGDSRGDYDEQSVQFLWGGDVGDLDVVLAGQFRQNSRLGWDERPILAQSGLNYSSNSPGNWRVPDRGPDGQYLGTTSNAVDPNCGTAAGREGYQKDTVANPFGLALGTTCFFDFGDSRSYREPTETGQFFGNVTWEVDDGLTLSSQGFWTRLAERTYSSTSNPGNSRIGELPAIRGELPGNPFRAVNSLGQPLFGVDNNLDGLPDRGTADLNGDGLGDAILTGNGGLDPWIPLYEDVDPRTLRPINKTQNLPSTHAPDFDNLSDNVDHIGRWSMQADFDMPFIEGWRGMAAYTYNYQELDFVSNQNYDIEAMKQGLSCDIVNDASSCYNPWFGTDPSTYTSQQVLEDIAASDREQEENKLSVIDFVTSGDLPLGGFELPGGPIGAAFGYQYREESFKNTPSAVELAGNTWIGGTEAEVITSGTREIDALFVELAVPVLDNLELELAVRREEFSTGQSSTDPKFGVTYAPTDWLTLRATNGDAFIAPELQDLFDPVSCGLSTVTDRFGPFSAFTTACQGGNPNLKNELAESTSVGFDLQFDSFDFHVTWNQTDFQNRIVNTSGQQIMELDFLNFQQATGFSGDGRSAATQPTEAQLVAWDSGPLSDPRIIRDPGNIFEILQVNTGVSNAESVKVTAYDIQGTYRFSFDNIGDFRINLQATYIDEFLYQEDPTQPIVNAAGLYNDNTNAAPELPQIKANLRTSWVNGNHSIVSTIHYIDDMPYDGPTFSFLDNFGNTFRPGNIVQTGVLAWTDMDLAYTYRGFGLFDGEANFTIGSRNIFDREAQRSPEFAGVLGGLQDPLGRVIYGRLVYEF